MAIAAAGHRTPTALFGAGIVVKKEAAGGVSAEAQAGAATLSNNFGSRASHGSEEPVQSALARGELEMPSSAARNEFVMAFGYAKNLIDKLNRLSRHQFAAGHRGEGGVQGALQAAGFPQKEIRALWIGFWKRQKLAATLSRNDSGLRKKAQQVLPRESRERAQFVAEIDGEAPSDEMSDGGLRHGGPLGEA